ncbi:MAG: glycosyltransferase [Planctomycetes bacterium]|nr:glycosyltransferase [Planctomycetota bacterium]
MTLLDQPARPTGADLLGGDAGWLGRLAGIVSRLRLQAVVHTGCGDGALAAELEALGLPMVLVDVRPEPVRAARARFGARHRVLQGRPARVLADLRRQLPRDSLWVFASSGLPTPTVRDEIFQVARGRGAIAIVLDRGVPDLAAVQDQLLRWSPDHHVEYLVTAGGAPLLLALPRPRVHVTFLIEKYTHEYGKSGPSINLDNLVATLDETGLASWNVVHYDECFHEGRRIPSAAISKPEGADVHVLACTLHYHSRANPSVEELRAARATGSRVAFFWLDKQISRSTPGYYEVADLNVVLDGNDFELPNAWPIYTPKNPRFFHDPGLPRDIDVSLVGEVRYLSQRRAIVDRLRQETRVDVRLFGTSAADTGRALSIPDYARLFQTSKISLAMTKDAVRQLKGRVFEILHCGAMLLCDRNHHVSHYLEPMVEYVTYGDYEDLVAKARYYLDHEDERAAIARAGHARVKSHYDHRTFWNGILARLGGSAAAFHLGEAR